MPRILTLAALLLVAGCRQQTDQNGTMANEAGEALQAPAVEVPSLNGAWKLTEVDGRPIDGGSTVATFADGALRIVAGCSRRAWTFTHQRNIVSFAADPGGSANCESPPTSRQDAAFRAVDRATMAIFDPDGREANLSGGGGNVTLERS